VKKILFSVLIIFLNFSCSLDYDSSFSDSLDESIPTSRLYGVKRVQVQGGQPKVTFQAEEAIVWEKREETELIKFVFNEFGSGRDVITTGEAEYLLISDNNDAKIQGHIQGYSLRNEASVKAENLSWLDEKRELSSMEESRVTIMMDNGSLLEGAGFVADLYTNTTIFSYGIGGSLESGSKDE
jgi:hypothetical protein